MDFSEEDLADVFATYVSCLNYAVDRASDTREALEFCLVRLRLTRWGEAVNVYDKPALGRYDHYSEDLREARQSLVGFIVLFDTGNKNTKESFSFLNSTDQEAQLLQEALGAIASKRFSQGSSLLEPQALKFGRWSEMQFQHASNFAHHLENLFGSQHLRELCASERLQIMDEDAP